jgi:hypothetical protein
MLSGNHNMNIAETKKPLAMHMARILSREETTLFGLQINNFFLGTSLKCGSKFRLVCGLQLLEVEVLWNR